MYIYVFTNLFNNISKNRKRNCLSTVSLKIKYVMKMTSSLNAAVESFDVVRLLKLYVDPCIFFFFEDLVKIRLNTFMEVHFVLCTFDRITITQSAFSEEFISSPSKNPSSKLINPPEYEMGRKYKVKSSTVKGRAIIR